MLLYVYGIFSCTMESHYEKRSDYYNSKSVNSVHEIVEELCHGWKVILVEQRCNVWDTENGKQSSGM